MPEHMNIALMLERPTSPMDRLATVSTLATAFAPFFGKAHEVCRINYVTGASECEAWSKTPRLLKEEPGKHELLFVYGDRAALLDGSRSSIHTDSNGARISFVVSLPLPRNLALVALEPHLLETAQSIGRTASSFVIAAGWEIEVDLDMRPQDMLRGSFADFSSCRWLAGPTPLLSVGAQGFAAVSRSEDVTLLKRV